MKRKTSKIDKKSKIEKDDGKINRLIFHAVSINIERDFLSEAKRLHNYLTNKSTKYSECAFVKFADDRDTSSSTITSETTRTTDPVMNGCSRVCLSNVSIFRFNHTAAHLLWQRAHRFIITKRWAANLLFSI